MQPVRLFDGEINDARPLVVRYNLDRRGPATYEKCTSWDQVRAKLTELAALIEATTVWRWYARDFDENSNEWVIYRNGEDTPSGRVAVIDPAVERIELCGVTLTRVRLDDFTVSKGEWDLYKQTYYSSGGGMHHSLNQRFNLGVQGAAFITLTEQMQIAYERAEGGYPVYGSAPRMAWLIDAAVCDVAVAMDRDLQIELMKKLGELGYIEPMSHELRYKYNVWITQNRPYVTEPYLGYC